MGLLESKNVRRGLDMKNWRGILDMRKNKWEFNLAATDMPPAPSMTREEIEILDVFF
jgi:hypothetical protein